MFVVIVVSVPGHQGRCSRHRGGGSGARKSRGGGAGGGTGASPGAVDHELLELGRPNPRGQYIAKYAKENKHFLKKLEKNLKRKFDCFSYAMLKTDPL